MTTLDRLRERFTVIDVGPKRFWGFKYRIVCSCKKEWVLTRKEIPRKFQMLMDHDLPDVDDQYREARKP